MKRKLLLLGCILFLPLAFWSRKFWLPYADIKGQDELSLRAQEFITSQRQTGTSLWNTVSMETPSTQVLGSQSFAMSCFSVQFPWNVIEQSREDDQGSCTFRGHLTGKPTTLSLHSQPYDQPLSEYTGVMIRMRDTQTYQREPVVVAGEDMSMFFRDADSSVLFSKKGNRLRTVALSGGIEQERRASVLVSILEKMEIP